MAECSRSGGRGSPEVTDHDDRFTARQAELLRALGHPVRLRIVQHLRDGEHCVCEFEPLLGLRQPNISQHLAILRAADLVNTRRDGLRIMYSLADPAILQVIDAVAEIIGQQSVALVALSQGRS